MNGTQTALFEQNNISLICNRIYIYILRLNYCFWLNIGIKNFIVTTTMANFGDFDFEKKRVVHNNVLMIIT